MYQRSLPGYVANGSIQNMIRAILSVSLLVLIVSCNKSTTKSPTSAVETGPTVESPVVVPPSTDAERPMMTRAECEAKSGRIVSDIGDGAIHRPDYTCESGKPPLASIKPAEGEPIASEGAVCCP